MASARQALQLLEEGSRSEDIAAGKASLQGAEANLSAAQTSLDDTQLKAPASGVILSRLREPGAIVATSDAHYLTVGRITTIVGTLISVGTAYMAMRFNNIMDMLQLVFSFVNAPLFATFLLGMFWRRTTGHAAFWGLVSGTLAAAGHYELTGLAGGGSLLAKIAVLHVYRSDMAQNFWGAIWAWTTCFGITILISLVTAPRPVEQLKGLVFGLTPALKTAQPDLHGTLKQGGRGASGTRHRTQAVFVVVEMALALVNRGWRYGRDLIHLCFPHAAHDEKAWGMRLHLPMQFFTGAVARASRRSDREINANPR